MIKIVAFLIVGTALVWAGSEWLESSSVGISDYYNIPPIVRGSVITAFGSSFPEFSSIMIATLIHGELELGISIVIGSAIFNVLVIPGLAGIKSDGGLNVDREMVSREVGLYALVVLMTIVFFYLSNYISNNSLDISSNTVLSSELAVVLVLSYGLYILYQWKTTQDKESEAEVSESFSIYKSWGKILVSLVLIGVGVEALVRAVIDLGTVLDTPSFFWGLIIVAGSSSLPDAFVSIKQADDDNDSASVANVMGSNIFDLLVVLGTGVLLSSGVSVNLLAITPILAFLLISTLVVMAFIRTGDTVSDKESYALLIIYSLFIVWTLLEAFGYIGLVPI